MCLYAGKSFDNCIQQLFPFSATIKARVGYLAHILLHLVHLDFSLREKSKHYIIYSLLRDGSSSQFIHTVWHSEKKKNTNGVMFCKFFQHEAWSTEMSPGQVLMFVASLFKVGGLKYKRVRQELLHTHTFSFTV